MSVAERLIRRNGTRAQYEFALEAKSMLPACDASVLAASNEGLHVLAKDEASLAMRFDAPFARLLGLPRELAALSGGTATHMFQPVADRPGKRRPHHAFSHRYPDRPRASETPR